MSEDSSITVDQPSPRQNGNDQGGQVVPFPNRGPPPPTPTARRILIIQNHVDVVSVLSSISVISRQEVYIMSGRGYVSEATLVSLPSRQRLRSNGLRNILYLSGWFRPTSTYVGVAIPFSRSNGILHVSLSGDSQSIAMANTLIAFGHVEVDVVFACGPGSIFPPDAPDVQRAPIRILINARPVVPQAHVVE